MSAIIYLNGKYMQASEAQISVFDRGFLFADAVYEVTTVLKGELLDFDGHAARLERSLRELDMPIPMSKGELLEVNKELVRRNAFDTGVVYLQISRGTPMDFSRSFVYPDAKTTKQTILLFTIPIPTLSPSMPNGKRVISIPDMRWGRRDIKTVQLLYPSMGKMKALKAGVDDGWFVQDGKVNEATASNAFIVKGNTLITRPLSNQILHGVTRFSVVGVARDAGMEVEERPFTIAEAQVADEAFESAANYFVHPVVEIDGVKIGSGLPGPAVARLRQGYVDAMLKSAIPSRL